MRTELLYGEEASLQRPQGSGHSRSGEDEVLGDLDLSGSQ